MNASLDSTLSQFCNGFALERIADESRISLLGAAAVRLQPAIAEISRISLFLFPI